MTRPTEEVPLSLRVSGHRAVRRVQAGGVIPYDGNEYQDDELLPLVGQEVLVLVRGGGLKLRVADGADALVCYASVIGEIGQRRAA
jgi:hypothetical protein